MPNILSNTLNPIIESWDDPGDYPSAAGSGPLPSFDYIAGCEGNIRAIFTLDEYATYNRLLQEDDPTEALKQFFNLIFDDEIPTNIDKSTIKWKNTWDDTSRIFEIEDCEGGIEENDYEPSF